MTTEKTQAGELPAKDARRSRLDPIAGAPLCGRLANRDCSHVTARTLFRSIREFVASFTLLVGASLGTAVANAADADLANAHAQAAAANPAGVSFTIELVDGQTRFHVGEMIPLDLKYRFDKAGEFLINDGLARGSGTARLLEVFRVSPLDGTVRQARDEPSFRRSAGGTPLAAKADHAYDYRVYLNEWRRFDEPGKYRFYCTSARVWKPNAFPKGDNDLRLTSNLLELEILPVTTQWQEEQLRQAVDVFNAHTGTTKGHQEMRREALRRLRCLDSEAAVRELARRYPGHDEEESYEIGMALHWSRHKAAAVEELRQRLDATDFVVSAKFLSTLANLAADVEKPLEYGTIGNDAASRERMERLGREHYALEQSLLAEYADATWAAAETKEPLVRARTMLELIQLAKYPGLPGAVRLSPARLARVRKAVAPVFNQLPEEEQRGLLASQWKQLGGADFLPTLRDFIAAAPELGEYVRFDSPLDWAFRRLFQLSPNEGRTLFLAELRRARPRITLDSLALLPDRPIPELDESLATLLEESTSDLYDCELASALVARYGSAAIYDRVRNVYGDKGGQWACALQSSMLAYFLRHKPEEGAKLVKQAVGARAWTGCYRTVLTAVGRIRMTNELEKIAVEHLDDEDPEVAADAAQLLGQRGSAAAEPILWRRFEKWHAAWSDRAGELTTEEGARPSPQVRFEAAMVNAIGRGTNWITDLPKLKRLRSLCLTDSGRRWVDGWIDDWSEPVAIQFSPGTEGEFPISPDPGYFGAPANDNWYVAQYSASSLGKLKPLLARFPRGMKFGFPTGMLTDPQAEERLFNDLKEYLASHGQELVKAPHPD